MSSPISIILAIFDFLGSHIYLYSYFIEFEKFFLHLIDTLLLILKKIKIIQQDKKFIVCTIRAKKIEKRSKFVYKECNVELCIIDYFEVYHTKTNF